VTEDYARLSDPAFRREIERRGDFFVAEGELVIRALVDERARWPVRSVLLTPALRERLADALSLLDPGVPVYVEPLEVLRDIVGFNVHRGALATADRGEPLPVASVLSSGARTVLALEGINDHENVGSIFRNAAAFGADGVVLDSRTADPLYRRSLRVSMGHALRVPFARSIAWMDDVRAHGFVVVALTPSADATPIQDFARPARIALALGAERDGLSDETLAAADHRVHIPIAAGVDSLNVAVAAAVALSRLL
jgi:tRNA G18 (ribose-2'-O)-methylase SpoU